MVLEWGMEGISHDLDALWLVLLEGVAFFLNDLCFWGVPDDDTALPCPWDAPPGDDIGV